MLCKCCPAALGYCKNIVTPLVTDQELQNPEFVRDVRNFAANLNISSHRFADTLIDMFRDYRGWVSRDGKAWEVRTRLLYDLDTDEQINPQDIKRHETKREVWFRSFASPVPQHIRPYIRVEARDRARVVSTILRTRFSDRARQWGKPYHR